MPARYFRGAGMGLARCVLWGPRKSTNIPAYRGLTKIRQHATRSDSLLVNNGVTKAGGHRPQNWSLETTMLPFFADLVVRTDEARRAFETHPKVLAAVADGMPLARYRALLLELYSVVWHFNPVCAAAASRIADTHQQVRYHLYEHMHEEMGHEQWVMNDLEAVGVNPDVVRAHQP